MNIAFKERAIWYKSLVLFPVISIYSRKIIWPFTKAMHGVAVWTGPGSPVKEVGWITQEEYTFLKLKGEIL